MNGRFQISLRCFFVVTVLFVAPLRWCQTNMESPPIQLRQRVMGRVTSPNNEEEEPLTLDEAAHVFSARIKDSSRLDPFTSVEPVKISFDETIIEPPRVVPLFECEMELRRSFYICDAICTMKDGSEQRVKFRIEKNHFHSLKTLHHSPFFPWTATSR